MNTELKSKINQFVNLTIATNHKDMILSLSTMKLDDLIKQNNPYYAKTYRLTTAHAYVKRLIDDYLFSLEEKKFNSFLTQMVIFIASELNNGKKSTYRGIDLEIYKNGIEYFLHIEQSPNSDSTSETNNIIDVIREIETSNGWDRSIVPGRVVYGSFYGVEDQPDKKDYLRLCGNRFWEFISEDPNFYLEIFNYLDDWSAMNDNGFFTEYSRLLNVFEAQFLKSFCPDGYIDWTKLVKVNSSGYDS